MNEERNNAIFAHPRKSFTTRFYMTQFADQIILRIFAVGQTQVEPIFQKAVQYIILIKKITFK